MNALRQAIDGSDANTHEHPDAMLFKKSSWPEGKVLLRFLAHKERLRKRRPIVRELRLVADKRD